ncbi:MAG: hypothetical protein AVDCRST_MAG89-1215, partial [uncultured Gemmatimonadetes bacterium]
DHPIPLLRLVPRHGRCRRAGAGASGRRPRGGPGGAAPCERWPVAYAGGSRRGRQHGLRPAGDGAARRRRGGVHSARGRGL